MSSKGYGEPDFQGFQKLVTTAGVREIFATGNNAKELLGVVIKALTTNTGKIYIGGINVAATACLDLDPGDALSLKLGDALLKMGVRINLAKLWIDAAVSGEGVNYLVMRE